jgi:hypothetical protein
MDVNILGPSGVHEDSAPSRDGPWCLCQAWLLHQKFHLPLKRINECQPSSFPLSQGLGGSWC